MLEPKFHFFDLLRDTWWIGVLALCVSLIVTPVVRFIAYRAKVVDRPDELLKPHGRPVAYLGGVAMCLGLLAGLVGYVTIMPDVAGHWGELKADISSARFGRLLVNPLWNLIFIALASVLVTVVGLLDDIVGIKPRQKVYGQAAAAVLLLVGGVGDRMASVLFFYIAPSVWIIIPLSVVMCLLIVIAACNATNLLDGLDGLCGGVTSIIAVGFLALAVFLATWDRFPGTDGLRIGLCLAMSGAVLGFLPYNIPPASIFMGDAGSMLLGFFVATMMVLFCQEANLRWFMAACAVFALPILDTALAVIRRVLGRRSIFAGDRSHLYDQLVDRGMTVKQVVGLFYALAAVTAVVGVVVALFVRIRHAIPIYLVLLVIIWTIFYKLGMISPPPREHQAAQDDQTGKND